MPYVGNPGIAASLALLPQAPILLVPGPLGLVLGACLASVCLLYFARIAIDPMAASAETESESEVQPEPETGTGTNSDQSEALRLENADLRRQLEEALRQAGDARLSTGVLHNVANVLNSVSTSAGLLTDALDRSKVVKLSILTTNLMQRQGDLGNYLTNDPKGKLIPDLLFKMANFLVQERETLRQEVGCLREAMSHVKEMIGNQQKQARSSSTSEGDENSDESLADLIESVLVLQAQQDIDRDIAIETSYEAIPPVRTNRAKVHQILANLLSNAVQALAHTEEPRIEISLTGVDEFVRITVRDNGSGIAQDSLDKLFDHGFTTKAEGHGFGLHHSINSAKELGGSLGAKSDGPGQGAEFELTLPCTWARTDAPVLT